MMMAQTADRTVQVGLQALRQKQSLILLLSLVVEERDAKLGG